MKSNFFKIVFQVFTLMLAITASLAFTPAEINIEKDYTLYKVSYEMSKNVCKDLLTRKDCQLTGVVPCTHYFILLGTKLLYLDPTDPVASTLNPPVTTRCSYQLFKVGS